MFSNIADCDMLIQTIIENVFETSLKVSSKTL